MPVIKTIKDLPQDNSYDTGPTRSSMPNPWSTSGRTLGTGAVVHPPQSYDYEQQQHAYYDGRSTANQTQHVVDMSTQPDDLYWSYNLQGQQPKWYHILLNCCAPCFVGPPCSENRKKDWRRLLWSFIAWITVVQIIMFIVEICIKGFADPFTRFPPRFGPPPDVLLLLGAKNSYLIKYEYQLWRLVTPIFLHSDILHLLFNMVIQLAFGLGYERKWNPLRLIPIYFITGIGGTLLSCVALPHGIGVGASGAILGLLGAKAGWIICNWLRLNWQMRIYHMMSIAFIILFTFIASFSEYVDWAAHMGGLALGVFCGLLFFCNDWKLKDKKAEKACKIISGVVGACVILGFFVTFSLVFAFASQPSI